MYIDACRKIVFKPSIPIQADEVILTFMNPTKLSGKVISKSLISHSNFGSQM